MCIERFKNKFTSVYILYNNESASEIPQVMSATKRCIEYAILIQEMVIKLNFHYD